MRQPDGEPAAPRPGTRYTMPDGTVERVLNTASDWSGLRVNGVTVWQRPQLSEQHPVPPAVGTEVRDTYSEPSDG